MGLDFSNLSDADRNTVQDAKNSPEFESGFEESSTGGDFDFMFDDFEFENESNSSSNSSDGGLDLGSGGTSSLNSSGGWNSPGGLSLNANNNQSSKSDIMDKAMEAAEKGMGIIWGMISNICKNIKLRTADDYGYFFTVALRTSIIMVIAGVLIGIFGSIGGIGMLSIFAFPFQITLAGVMTFGIGLTGIGLAALYIELYGNDNCEDYEDTEDLPQEVSEEEYDSEASDALEDLFGLDDDIFSEGDEIDEEDWTFASTENNEPEDTDEKVSESNSMAVYEQKIDSIAGGKPILTRSLLFDVFVDFLPLCTPNFSEEKTIEPGSTEFQTIETLALKALAAASKMELAEVTEKTSLESIKETLYTLSLRMKRIKGLKKLDDIADEITTYFRKSADDESVSCKVDLEGDYYRITVSKGTSAIVTLGDALKDKEVADFIKNSKNKLPIVVGITNVGKPILFDAKDCDSMLIAGKPRSGKSWFILNILWEMMLFNTPEDVQLLIIDPKCSTLFKTLSLMPHVCGLNDDTNVLKILDDVVTYEGARRKKLLLDNKCETIWELRDKGIKVPILYVVIDEVMTITLKLGANAKEFLNLIKIIITQLPSQGIRVIFIPHRAKGVVDPAIRTNLGFIAAVKAEIPIVLETLNINSWKEPLINIGDTALKIGNNSGKFVRSVAVTPSNNENTTHIMAVASTFYKMGVEIPDMSSIGEGFNRDENAIREELKNDGVGSNRVEFDINDIDDVSIDEPEDTEDLDTEPVEQEANAVVNVNVRKEPTESESETDILDDISFIDDMDI